MCQPNRLKDAFAAAQFQYEKARGCDGKVQYWSGRSAARAADKMEARTGNRFNSYRCKFCGALHVGKVNLKWEERHGQRQSDRDDGDCLEEDCEEFHAEGCRISEWPDAERQHSTGDIQMERRRFCIRYDSRETMERNDSGFGKGW